VFSGDVTPLEIELESSQGEGRALPDMIVNGRAEYRRSGDAPLLEPGDVLHETAEDCVYRVPLVRAPRWSLTKGSERTRDDFFELLERQAALAEVDFGQPHARHLFGAARAYLLGALRCEWHRGFVVSARWSPALTTPASMAWHLWNLLASPAGVGLERFSGTPVDQADLDETAHVAMTFPSPRLRQVRFETNERLTLPASGRGVQFERAPLRWLDVERSGPLPEHVVVDGPTSRPRVHWRQLLEVRVNGRTPGDRCLWHSGLWVELRLGDEVTWPGGWLRAVERTSEDG
jgi:hypothetical protein